MPMPLKSHLSADCNADGLVVFDLETGDILSGNRSAATVWQLLAQNVTPAEVIASCVAANPETPQAVVEDGVRRFIDVLRTRKLWQE